MTDLNQLASPLHVLSALVSERCPVETGVGSRKRSRRATRWSPPVRSPAGKRRSRRSPSALGLLDCGACEDLCLHQTRRRTIVRGSSLGRRARRVARRPAPDAAPVRAPRHPFGPIARATAPGRGRHDHRPARPSAGAAVGCHTLASAPALQKRRDAARRLHPTCEVRLATVERRRTRAAACSPTAAPRSGGRRVVMAPRPGAARRRAIAERIAVALELERVWRRPSATRRARRPGSSRVHVSPTGFDAGTGLRTRRSPSSPRALGDRRDRAARGRSDRRDHLVARRERFSTRRRLDRAGAPTQARTERAVADWRAVQVGHDTNRPRIGQAACRARRAIGPVFTDGETA